MKDKIAIIAHGLSGGGAERVASIVANYFADLNYQVLFVAAYSEKREYELDPRIRYAAVKTNSSGGMMRFIERSFSIRNMVREFGAEIAFSFITNELIPLEFSGVEVIPSLRIDPKSTDSSFIRRHIRRFVYHHAKNVIFQTEDAKNYFDGSIRKKGVIIGNPLKRHLPVWDEEGHRKIFMTACRITKQKNIPMLINAFIRFHQDYPDYGLEICGDGEPAGYKEKMEGYVAEKGAAGYIVFKGHLPDIHNIMCDAEAFILTSDYEGLSNSMLEAMAIGLPCICTDCPPGGARGYIRNNVSGILIPVGDETELDKAMRKIADSGDFRHKISESSRYVRDVLNQDDICRQWENLIH